MFEQIKDKINRAQRIALFHHVDPDFDCLGSMYGLYYALCDIKKNVTMFTYAPLSYKQSQLFDGNLLKIGDFNKDDFDLLIAVDTPTLKRLGEYGHEFAQHQNTIKIDHHMEANASYDFAKVNYVDSSRSSCCEIIFELLEYLKYECTPLVATMLYAGLTSDTYSFINSNTNDMSLLCGYRLVEYGADMQKVNTNIHRFVTMKELAATKMLYDRIEIVDGEIAIAAFSHQILQKEDITKVDCSTFSSLLANIEGVKVSCNLLEVSPKHFDGSLRSKSKVDVSKIASAFGGGGHKQAAGCQFEAESLSKAKEMVISEIQKYLK